ncbi:MAG: aminotransferase class III-fold pyridoxal phosphate-dependent enzyme [Betaproteobacteria bacterium]|nr:aminotransferase class III-fold pyridoxal phosphate-dependent enzyme [Betaproteobacteria bacterium]
MGNPMAANLIKAGYPVAVFDIARDKADKLIRLGAAWAPGLTEGAGAADLVITSLPGPAQIREVMLGDAGILASARPGTTVIDTSTSAVELVRELVALAEKRKLDFLEAPVTNAVDFAVLGKLSIFVGGSKDGFDKHKPIFEVLGEKIFYVGAPGNGATLKLLTNLLWFVGAAAIGEGLMLGAKAGISLDTVWEAIKSSAGNSWVAEHDVPSIFAGHYDPSFSLALCCKDLALINEIAHVQGFPLAMGAVAKSLFDEARSKYGDAAGELHVVRLLEERAGLLLRPPNGVAVETRIAQPRLSNANAPTAKQPSLMAQARKHMPQGVAENYRYWGDERTVFIENAKGCRLTDCDGKSYVDFRLGYGPIILGYRDERVDRAVVEQITQSGTLSGFSTALDTTVVKQIKALCPNIDKVRFANSGTEAVMGAVRTARGFTRRDRIAIVEGGFHGLYDEMMWKSDVENWDPRGRAEPAVIPFGGGVPQRTRELVDIIGLNDFETLERLFAARHDTLACVVLEPIIGNCGSIAASQAWLQHLRDLCTQHGTLLLLDEVKTGFRVARGGAQELYGIHADLTTYAKAMGNGYPVAAFGGRAEVMDVVGSHKGGVVHGGTYTANLVALSAAHATLKILTDTDALRTVDRVGAQIRDLLGRVFSAAGIEHAFAGPPAMFGIHFTPQVPTNYRDWRITNSELYRKFAWNLIDLGVMLEPDSREPWFICEAHQHLDLGWLEEIATRAMVAARAA